MVVWLYQGTGGTGRKDALIDPIAYLNGARVPVQVIYSYQGGVRSLVWSRAPMTLTTTPSQWDTISVLWTAPGAGADSYVLYRNGTQVYAGPSMAHTSTLLDPASTYTYRLDAIRAGAVVSSITQSATTPARTLTLAVQSADYSSVTLKWTDPVVGSINKYRIKRGGVAIATVNAPATTYTDGGLAYNQTYTYQVEALRAEVVIQPVSNIVSQTLTARPPMVLTTSGLAWDRVTLNWTDPAADAATYMIQRGSTVLTSTLAGTARTFASTMLLPSTAYPFTLTAKNAAGATIGTATVSATTPARADMGLVATATAYNNIAVSWTDSSAGVGHYNVYDGSSHIHAGAANIKSFNHAVGASTGHNYTLYAYRDNPPGTWEIMPVADTVYAATGGRPSSQKFVELAAVSSASYNQSGNRGIGDMYYGWFSTNQGQQQSLWCFNVPAAVRNCISIDRVDIAIYNVHHFYGSGGKVALVIHHGGFQGGFPATHPGSTSPLTFNGPIWKPTANRNAWMDAGANDGAWMTNCQGLVAPGRTTLAEEFRVNNAQGLGLVGTVGNAQGEYGYAAGAGSGTKPAIRIWYSSWDA